MREQDKARQHEKKRERRRTKNKTRSNETQQERVGDKSRKNRSKRERARRSEKERGKTTKSKTKREGTADRTRKSEAKSRNDPSVPANAPTHQHNRTETTPKTKVLVVPHRALAPSVSGLEMCHSSLYFLPVTGSADR